jgi:hypothetical protein
MFTVVFLTVNAAGGCYLGHILLPDYDGVRLGTNVAIIR